MKRKIDTNKTKQCVEKALSEAQYYKFYGFMRNETQITPSYEPRYHGQTNVISKPTESVAEENVVEEEEAKRNYERVCMAVENLPERELTVIKETYFVKEKISDWKIADRLHISSRTVERAKLSAKLRLAHMLKLEVFVD